MNDARVKLRFMWLRWGEGLSIQCSGDGVGGADGGVGGVGCGVGGVGCGTLMVHPSSHRTSLKFFPRMEPLLVKHTLMIFAGVLLAATVFVGSNCCDWLVGSTFLQDRVAVSPDISTATISLPNTHHHTHSDTHTQTHTLKHTHSNTHTHTHTLRHTHWIQTWWRT